MAGLLEGLQLADIAQRYGVTVNTVRTQIQRLFDKTKTNRQSDLVRVVASSLPPLRADGQVTRRSSGDGALPEPG